MLRGIRNIIFDLGGVIINIDYHLCVESFRKIGMENFDSLYSKARQNDLFDQLEKGRVLRKDFYNRLRPYLKNNVHEEEIEAAWNAMLLDIPKERLLFLEKLKSRFRLFLLSNTNEIHLSAINSYLRAEHNLTGLSHLFEKEYLSCRIGMRKPDRELFDYVLADSSISAEETLFIDDSPQHIEGAAQSGIRSYLLEKEKSINELLTPDLLA